MSLNGAKLDHRVTRQVRSLTTTGATHNEQIEEFTAGESFWAARKDATVGERARASEIAAGIQVFFTLRYSPESAAIVPQDRLSLEGGLTYDVIGIRELQRNKWLEVQCGTRTDKV